MNDDMEARLQDLRQQTTGSIHPPDDVERRRARRAGRRRGITIGSAAGVLVCVAVLATTLRDDPALTTAGPPSTYTEATDPGTTTATAPTTTTNDATLLPPVLDGPLWPADQSEGFALQGLIVEPTAAGAGMSRLRVTMPNGEDVLVDVPTDLLAADAPAAVPTMYLKVPPVFIAAFTRAAAIEVAHAQCGFVCDRTVIATETIGANTLTVWGDSTAPSPMSLWVATIESSGWTLVLITSPDDPDRKLDAARDVLAGIEVDTSTTSGLPVVSSTTDSVRFDPAQSGVRITTGPLSPDPAADYFDLWIQPGCPGSSTSSVCVNGYAVDSGMAEPRRAQLLSEIVVTPA